MDVLVEGPAPLAIENKFGATEQSDQVKDYLGHLAQVTRSGGRPYLLLYLTPNGQWPDSLTPAEREAAREAGSLHRWSYGRELRRWLESCRQQCAAAKIQHFLSDFLNFIDTTVKLEDGADREENDHEY